MARSIWTGSINFGLVNIPIRLFTAVRDREVHFHMLSAETHTRLRRKMVSPGDDDERDVKQTETVRGYEVAPDQYVVVENKELENLRPEATHTIDIRDFVDLEQIDPIYYERAYYALPDDRGAKPYRLLHEAMQRSKKVAIANFVMRQKEYLVALRPRRDIMCLETMHFADEIVPAAELPAAPQGDVDKRELEVANRLIEALVTDFEPEKYKNVYRDRVLELVEKKAAGEQVEIRPAPAKPGVVINLMDALKASLADTESRGRKPAATEKRAARTARGGGRTAVRKRAKAG